MNRQQLIEDNMKLVHGVTHKYFPHLVHDEDIVQCGMIGLCLAADSWDSEKTAFSTYAYRCIYNEIVRELKRRGKSVSALSLDYEYSLNDEGDSTTFGDKLIGDFDVDFVDMDYVLTKLTPREKQCFELRATGKDNHEIAKILGINQRSVTRDLRKVKLLLSEQSE